MKKIHIILGAMVAIATFAIGCDKNVLDYGDVEKLTDGQALLKVNYVSYYKSNPSVVIKFNDKRVSSVITSRTPFPGGGYNTGGGSQPDFMIVNPGALKLTIAVPFKKDTGLDSLVLYNTTLQIAAGGRYVVHITDTATNTKTFVTEEDFKMPDSGFCAYRFTNLMPDVPAVDLYYGSSATVHTADTLLAGNVSYLSMTNQFKVRFGQSRTWKIRRAGAALTTATILASYTSASTFTNSRVYNIMASGYGAYPTTPTTETRRPFVSFFLIR